MNMKIDTSKGPQDSGFQPYINPGHVSKAGYYENSADLSTIAGVTGQVLEGAIGIDKTNKIENTRNIVNNLTEEYLGQSPSHLNYLNNQLIDAKKEIETTTDPLKKSELYNTITSVTNKLTSAKEQGKIDAYEFEQRLYAELNPIINSNRHLSSEIIKEADDILKRSGVTTAIKLDTTLMNKQVEFQQQQYKALQSYIMTNKVNIDRLPNGINSSAEELTAVVNRDLSGKAFLSEMENMNKLDAEKDKAFIRQLKDLGVPHLVLEHAMNNIRGEVINLIFDKNIATDNKPFMLADTLNRASIAFSKHWSKLPADDPYFKELKGNFDKYIEVIGKAGEEKVDGTTLKKIMGNMVDIQANAQKIDVMNTINLERLKVLDSLSGIVDKIKLGGYGDSTNMKGYLISVMGGLVNSESFALHPELGRTIQEWKKENKGTELPVEVSKEATRTMTPDTDVSNIVNLQQFSFNQGKELTDPTESYRYNDATILAYTDEASYGKGKLTKLLESEIFAPIFEEQLQTSVNNTRKHIGSILKNNSSIVQYDDNLGRFTSVDNVQLNGGLKRLNAQIKAYANAMNKPPKEVASEFIEKYYGDFFVQEKGEFYVNKASDSNTTDTTNDNIPTLLKSNTTDSTDKKVDTPEVTVPTEDNNLVNLKGKDGKFLKYDNPEDSIKDVANQIKRYAAGEGIAKTPVTTIKDFLNLYRPASDWRGSGDVTQTDYEDFLVTATGVDSSTTPVNITAPEFMSKLIKALIKMEKGTDFDLDRINNLI